MKNLLLFTHTIQSHFSLLQRIVTFTAFHSEEETTSFGKKQNGESLHSDTLYMYNIKDNPKRGINTFLTYGLPCETQTGFTTK